MSTMTTNRPSTFADRLKGIAPDDFTSRREQAMSCFQEMQWPSMRHEAWRYTDTRPIAAIEFTAADPATTVDMDALAPFILDDGMPRIVFVDGVYQASCSTAANIPGVQIDRLSSVLAREPKRLADRLAAHADWKDDPASALSTAFLTDGVMIELAEGTSMSEPLHIIFFSVGGSEPISVHPRVLVVAGHGSNGTVIESHVGTSEHTLLTTPVTELIAGNDVHLDHYRLVREGAGTWHLGDLALHQGTNTEVSSCVLAFDGPVIRTRMQGTLAGENGNAILHGLALGHGKRHIENMLRVNHMVPNCRSREAFKHILEDNATAAFTGRIYVAKGAQKTDAVQTNRNLLLSSTARSTARPQLEIYADDVKCTHGATAGELDPEAMFYLQARGVPPEAARSLMVQAFAGEILDDVAPASLRAPGDGASSEPASGRRAPRDGRMTGRLSDMPGELQTGSPIDVPAIRAQFPLLARCIYDKPLVYLDSAATTPKPRSVIDTIHAHYTEGTANVHRAAHALSVEATEAFESARRRIAAFINAGSSDEIIFTRSATEAVNLVANAWAAGMLGSGDEILLTEMEHHANIVPWQLLRERLGFELRVAPMDDRGMLDLDAFRGLISDRTKLVSATWISNALGTVNPIEEIVTLAREAGATTLVDATQALPHRPVDVQSLGADFIVFSGHKMYGPTGIGCLWGRENAAGVDAPLAGWWRHDRDGHLQGDHLQPAPLEIRGRDPAHCRSHRSRRRGRLAR